MKHLNLRISIIILVGIDLLTKYFFYDMNYLHQTVLIEPIFNTGISWSLPVPYFMIIIISIIGIVVIIRLIAIKKISMRTAVFLLAGTIGNLIDRCIYGGVRDFIDIQIFNFPIFNFADIFLTVGIGLRILQVILEKRK